MHDSFPIPFEESLAIPMRFPSFSAGERRRLKRMENTGKRLPSEKKIAKPLFYRYIISAFLSKTIYQRAGVRVVEWARLESVCTGNSTEGSNPSLSAINFTMNVLPTESVFCYLLLVFRGIWARQRVWKRATAVSPFGQTYCVCPEGLRLPSGATESIPHSPVQLASSLSLHN